MFPAVSIMYPLEQAMPFPASIFRLLVFLKFCFQSL